MRRVHPGSSRKLNNKNGNSTTHAVLQSGDLLSTLVEQSLGRPTNERISFFLMPISDKTDTTLKNSKKLWKRLGIVVGVLAMAYAGAYGFFAYEMRQTPDEFARVMAHTGPVPFIVFPFESMWLRARAGAMKTGDTAPDFELPLLDHSGSVRLSSFRGDKPVVLIFGSYT